MATTDTKMITKTGFMITVTMNDDYQFKIDTTNHPTDVTLDMADQPVTLTAPRQVQADLVCSTMCQINF